MKRTLFLVATFVLWSAVSGCDALLTGAARPTRPERPARLYGGGATFLNPMMQRWIVEYEKSTGRKVNYQSLGSGAGIEHATTKTFDFGGTESPLNEKQLKRAAETGGDILHIPVCIGCVVPSYNLPGVEPPLRFTPKVLAGIFLGHIKKFNDPELQLLNPSVTLPDQDIAIVHRSDGSGTTYVWTDYLSKVSEEWKRKVGAATTVNWPVGVGHRGNEGVSQFIAKTPYTLGYNELSTAVNMKLQYGIVQNRDGVFIRPSLASITAAVDAGVQEMPDDMRFMFTNMPGKESYPITGAAWVLVYTNQKPEKGKALVEFLRWVGHDGQGYCDHLQYARLPASLVQRIDKKLERIKTAK